MPYANNKGADRPAHLRSLTGAFAVRSLAANSKLYVFIYIYMNTYINSSFFRIVPLLLLLQAGDIERNPGPSETPQDLSIAHLNIRSIRNKLDYIKSNFLDFDIICYSETHLDNSVTLDAIILDSFNVLYRKDRINYGGGLLMYFNSSLAYKRRPDLETYFDEFIWVQLQGKD